MRFVISGARFTKAASLGWSPLYYLHDLDSTTALALEAPPELIFRAPLIVRRQPHFTPAPFTPPNLLVTTLAPPIAAPVGKSAQDRPRPGQQPQPFTPPNLLVTTLRADSFMIHVWGALPPRRKVPAPQPPNLLVTTLAVPAAAPSGKSAQDRPRTGLQPQPFTPPNLLLTTLAAPAAKPFAQYDWPNPRLRRLVSRAPQFAPNLLVTTLAPALAPFVMHNWPPARSARRVATFEPQNILLTTLSTVPVVPSHVIPTGEGPARIGVGRSRLISAGDQNSTTGVKP